MSLFAYRNLNDKVIRGVVNCPRGHLFNRIDEQASPFAFEYAKLSPSHNNWFEDIDEDEWFSFKIEDMMKLLEFYKAR